jgi:hypothetical protein
MKDETPGRFRAERCRVNNLQVQEYFLVHHHKHWSPRLGQSERRILNELRDKKVDKPAGVRVPPSFHFFGGTVQSLCWKGTLIQVWRRRLCAIW